MKIEQVHKDRIKEILGREISEQGKKDLKLSWQSQVWYPYVWAIWLGDVC
jgi:hypothetical protein